MGHGNAIFVEDSRVSLDLIVEADLHGESAGQIADDVPTIPLTDVRGALSFYIESSSRCGE